MMIGAAATVLLSVEWTGLIYMAADNDLAAWADSDLVEIGKMNLNDDVRILIQLDKPNTGGGRYIAAPNGINLIADLGTIDMCDWRVLSDFLVWGITSYPAKRYFAVLWDHGSGWTAQPRRTFGSDWSSGNQMSIAGGDLKRALSNTRSATGKDIDLLIFDACLMQQIEVGAEMAAQVKILAGFQTLCPASGLNYHSFLGELNRRPRMSGNDLASIMVKTSIEEYKDRIPVSVAAFDLNYINVFAEKLKSVVEIVGEQIPPPAPVRDLRRGVQTIPAFGNQPSADDDLVDLGDLVAGLAERLSCFEVEDLSRLYHQAVISHGYWGDVYSRTSGMAVWFPLHYARFKSLVGHYQQLGWSSSKWPQFLNWWYDADDIRPKTPKITAERRGKRVELNWSRATDLAPVEYHLLEGPNPRLIFSDDCEDDEQLYLQGFTISADRYFSGEHSLFSGNAGNLDNRAWTKETIRLDNTGLLVMQLHYNTEDMVDSLIVEYGGFRDVFYGNSSGWQERRVVIPAGNNRLRLRYCTNETINRGGAYLDDIRIYELDDCRFIRTALGDTNLVVFNPTYGRRNYAVYAVDRYRNISNLSDLAEIVVDEYADPYSIPSPFSTSCVIVLDYPDQLDPQVEIFSVDGRRVKEYGREMINDRRVFWDGMDEGGNTCGAGIYYVLIKGDNFKKIGKIARQR